MKLTKTELSVLPTLAVDELAEERRNELAIEARKITSIATAGENDTARNIAVEIRTHVKEVEAARVSLTKPLLDGQRMLKKLSDDHIAPLEAELQRLQRLATVFLVEEEARVAAEMAARLELAAEAVSDSDFAIISNEALPVEARAQGQTLRKVLKYEVLDIHAIYRARPELCNLTIKASAVNSTCVPELPVPGLRLWFENASTFSTR